jgi:hypothetical protein
MNQEEDVSQLPTQNQEGHEHDKNSPVFDFQQLAHEEQEHKKEAATLEEPSTGSTQAYKKFISELRAHADPEVKLHLSISFMEDAIAQSGTPHFKEFWDARKLCLDLFKENINPSARMAAWSKYSELCRQARRLKDLFNEQSAFACEQIEMAVASLEKEVEMIPEWLKKIEPADIGSSFMAVEENFGTYLELQKELNLLNAYASRTNTLRKELIKTEMRIRQKNKFFERLSALGDKIFPRRKELIQQVSLLFMQDVEKFIQATFVSELKTVMLFDVREEIKALQAFAKVLTLNTEAFSKTRKSLSECWDSIKQVIKERRKVSSEQKNLFKEHRDEFVKEIEKIEAAIAEKPASFIDREKELDELVFKMRKTQLGKNEIKELRELVRKVRDTLLEISKGVDSLKRQEVQKKEQEERECFEKIQNAYELLLQEELPLSEIQERLMTLNADMAASSFTKAHKLQLEKLGRQVQDLIVDKKDRELLKLSQGDLDSIANLKSLLKDLKARRQEIKQSMDVLRKARSGLDFASAIQGSERLEVEKERLEKIESSIEELEAQIADIHSKKKPSS